MKIHPCFSVTLLIDKTTGQKPTQPPDRRNEWIDMQCLVLYWAQA